MKDLVLQLFENNNLSGEDLKKLILCKDEETNILLAQKARETSNKVYNKDIYIRGLIEFTNYCKNDCYYCGIRCSNKNAQRYRLSKEEILSCCKRGYEFGLRTFVLQGGEDSYFTDEKMVDIISSIKNLYKDCAITLSIGEKTFDSYKKYYESGADRFLLRHETANKNHYSKLHPSFMSYDNRMNCLKNLKEIGYQVGAGFMVGSPYQTVDDIVNDLMFLKTFSPHMVGIGPFIPHKDTPFKDKERGSVNLTLKLISIIRLLVPHAMIPATTALASLDDYGREKGVFCGANVIMPNLSPEDVRNKYLLYENKNFSGDDIENCINNIHQKMNKIGYNVVINRGDYRP